MDPLLFMFISVYVYFNSKDVIPMGVSVLKKLATGSNIKVNSFKDILKISSHTSFINNFEI